MSVFIHHLETSLPETSYDQAFASGLMQKNVGSRDGTKRIIRSIYNHSGIEKRHSVIKDFDKSGTSPLFFDKDGNRLPPPDTQTRNEIYTREARHHFTALAGQLIRNTPGFEKEDITHLITVSCTGFFAPGPDYHIVRDLGLPGTTQRYHIGFMGCYAAFQGLKMAEAFCRSQPDSVVLVLCVELCTLHLQFSDDTDAIISASVFADGGSGALVSARRPATTELPHDESPDSNTHPGTCPLEMLSFHSDLTPEGENDMAWTIGNEGFQMKLSTYVPDIIRKNIRPALETMLRAGGIPFDDISRWAIHPGGRAILDKIQDELHLADDQIAASRKVLREYGNMSSATILFVLKEMMDHPGKPVGETIFAMAFGPGLTIESALFQSNPSQNGQHVTKRAHTTASKSISATGKQPPSRKPSEKSRHETGQSL